jgi:hypothetical protein
MLKGRTWLQQVCRFWRWLAMLCLNCVSDCTICSSLTGLWQHAPAA